MSQVISARGLRKAYRNKLALDGASFEVAAGRIVGLIGPNGAGKTTLLRLIEGRLKPTSGQVVLGAGVRLGVLAQEHETLDPDLTCSRPCCASAR
jgi:ABC-type multidrug transport system ATPase subunit